MIPSERNFARRIDLTSLQLFVAVCELGSIGRAAEREFIAASAISKRLSDLEAALATPLLYRHARGVDLTPTGESLLHHARSVLYSLAKMQVDLSEYADGVRGHVRVHANISAIVQVPARGPGRFHAGTRRNQDRPRRAPQQRSDARGAGGRGRPRRLPCAARQQRIAEAALPARPFGIDFASGARPVCSGCYLFHSITGLRPSRLAYPQLDLCGNAPGCSGRRPRDPPAHPCDRVRRHVPHDRERPGCRRDAAHRLRTHGPRPRRPAHQRGAQRRMGRARDLTGGARFFEPARGRARTGQASALPGAGAWPARCTRQSSSPRKKRKP